ncbi:MAG: esterase/lipase family protein [Candidatus Odinarchaeota archaeon]
MEDDHQQSFARRAFNSFRHEVQKILSPKLPSDDLRDVATIYRLKELDSSWTLINPGLKLWRYFAEVPYQNYDLDNLSRFRPLLLVHGYQSNHTTWNWMVDKLWADGFRIIYAIEMSDYKKGFEYNVQQLIKVVDHLREIEPVFKEIDIIAHSMGGSVSKQFIKLEGGSSKVRLFIGLGSPLTGVYRFWKILASLDLAEQTGIDFSDTEGLLTRINEVITDEIFYTLTQVNVIGSLRRYLGTDGLFSNKPVPDMVNHRVPVSHFNLNKNEDIYTLIKQLLMRKLWFYKIRLLYIQNFGMNEEIATTDQSAKTTSKFRFKFKVKGKSAENYPRNKHIEIETGQAYFPTSPLITYVGMAPLNEKIPVEIQVSKVPGKMRIRKVLELELGQDKQREVTYLTLTPSKEDSNGLQIQLAIYKYVPPLFNY